MTATDVLLLLVLGIGYAIVCRLAPLARCRRCAGTGADLHHYHPPNIPLCAVRRCRRCRGTGLRPRLGARLLGTARRPDDR
ncbi:hypothetical protein ACIBSV_23500 [Embleya sp. NPDC050154]|uniref:hypothetical protein n=1 Tax=Embleya sp. NPDC050154 TaxID=3363988 RepID=UPI0037935A3E